jgi:ubiquinone/menaquinone biosynthesis C-methylase UbiE
MEKINLKNKFEIPDSVLGSLFLIIVVLSFSPYIGGVDLGFLKIPSFQPAILVLLKVAGPILIVLFMSLFIPLFKKETAKQNQSGFIEKTEMHTQSKYVLQSTPDIVIDILNKNNINTNGLKICAGFNINDLYKRVYILNPTLNVQKTNSIINNARETAFTKKYAAPQEDEKLLPDLILKELGLKKWDCYLNEFVKLIGVDNIENLTVLDVGIGNAYASHIFLKKCSNLFGVDVSNKALDYAKDKLPNAHLCKGSAENLTMIQSFSIDLYISLRTYQSTLFDMKQSLHEAYRVLAQGGRIIISIPSMFLIKDIDNNIVRYTKGLIAPYSKTPSMEYAIEIANRIKFYLELLGFYEISIYNDSPYEIYIGGIK